ncbi:MAG: hypothetical protein AAF899_12975 [Pseudomonadota bacterium]
MTKVYLHDDPEGATAAPLWPSDASALDPATAGPSWAGLDAEATTDLDAEPLAATGPLGLTDLAILYSGA